MNVSFTMGNLQEGELVQYFGSGRLTCCLEHVILKYFMKNDRLLETIM